MERDKFMNPTEAKEFGLIDKILEHPPNHSEKVNEVKPTDTTRTTISTNF